MKKEFLERLFNLNGKSVLITGAAGQFGRELCKAYLECGVKVFATDLDINRMRERLRELSESYSSNILFFEMDITKKDSVIKTFENIFSNYGSLDILINNAGVNTFEHFSERSEKTFDFVMDVNLKGTFLCIQKYANELIKRSTKGVIVNIASLYGVISPDLRIYTDCSRINSEIYGATKAGIIQMTRYFAATLAGNGIRVNCISPGGIFNPEAPQGKDFVRNYSFRCPMGRMANTEEMIGGVLYLSSDAATYTTGQNIIIDGGMSCW